jgi:hypothetical protein
MNASNAGKNPPRKKTLQKWNFVLAGPGSDWQIANSSWYCNSSVSDAQSMRVFGVGFTHGLLVQPRVFPFDELSAKYLKVDSRTAKRREPKIPSSQ